jgi:hypothetical protein
LYGLSATRCHLVTRKVSENRLVARQNNSVA